MSAGTIDVALRGPVGAFFLDAAFSVPARGVTGLFGPSGCGKTTILRCMAGLHRMEDGFCAVDGEVWQDAMRFRAPHQRSIGYVFQEASLFAHLTVRRNLLFGAPGKTPPRGTAAILFDEVLDLLGLARLLERSPEKLSGGERQRVAIGRALLSQPTLLLMDEPLSALDRGTKDEIMPFLERLHERLSLPMIYVTHDLGEIERLADHLVLLQAGRVLGAGPLSALQSDPALPLAGGREAAVSIEAEVAGYDARDGLLSLRFDGGSVLVPAPPLDIGVQRRLRIAAGDVSLAREPQESTILNTLPVRILSRTSLGDAEILAVLGAGDDGRTRILARITRRSWERLGLAPGQLVQAQIKSVSLAAK